MNLNHVYLGDCLEVLKTLPNDSVDLIVTSPPYAEKRENQYDTKSEEEYVPWFLEISKELYRVLKPTGSFVLNIKEGSKDGERQLYVYDLLLALKRQQGWKFVEEYPWYKKNPVPGKWKYRFKDAWEHCFHFTKQLPFKMNQEAVMIPATGLIKRSASEKDKIRRNSKTGSGFGVTTANFIDREMVMPSNVLHLGTASQGKHSAAYPVELPEFFIKLFTNENDVVLDPFMGSGTTAVACIRLKRNYIGIEKKPEHITIINERIIEANNNITPNPTVGNANPRTDNTNPRTDIQTKIA